mmetsp:Transcript_5922/g.16690  ORF Transcript_5922/g.16690 Transcript_5922/m.16690 type:complete len:123 (+) Transcript_5922:210-578(+)
MAGSLKRHKKRVTVLRKKLDSNPNSPKRASTTAAPSASVDRNFQDIRCLQAVRVQRSLAMWSADSSLVCPRICSCWLEKQQTQKRLAVLHPMPDSFSLLPEGGEDDVHDIGPHRKRPHHQDA